MKKKQICIVLMIIFIIIGSFFYFRKNTWQECLVYENEYKVKDEILDNYIIQGVCQAEQYTLVTAYNTETPLKCSIVMIYNPDGTLYNTIQLDDYTHAGSIAYYDGVVYVSGIGLQYGDRGYQDISDDHPNEALIEVYSFADFLHAKEYREIIHRISTLYYGDSDQDLFSSASKRGNSLFSYLTIGTVNDQICIIGGNYNFMLEAHLVIIPLSSIRDDGIIDHEQVKIYHMPINRAQGVCMVDENTFLITQSNGVFETNLILCKIDDSKLHIIDLMKIPAHGEQVSLKKGNTLIIAFENSDIAIRCFDYSKMKFRQ